MTLTQQMRSEFLGKRPVGRPRGSRDLAGRCLRAVSDVEGERWVRGVVALAIRRAREDANVSVSELAAAIGVDPLTVHHWESGRTGIGLRRLYQIAEALGVPVDHLVGAG